MTDSDNHKLIGSKAAADKMSTGLQTAFLSTHLDQLVSFFSSMSLSE